MVLKYAVVLLKQNNEIIKNIVSGYQEPLPGKIREIAK